MENKTDTDFLPYKTKTSFSQRYAPWLRVAILFCLLFEGALVGHDTLLGPQFNWDRDSAIFLFFIFAPLVYLFPKSK